MRNISPTINRKSPTLQAFKTCTLCLFIALVIAAIASPAAADTICMNYSKAFHKATILSETKDTVRVKLRDGYVMELPRKRISLILKPGMKVYVYKNNWTGCTAWFKGSDETGYTFTARPDGTDGFTVKIGDLLFMSDIIPGKAGQASTVKPPPSMELNAWSLLFAAGFFQGIFLAIMLFRRKNGNLKANRVLALFIISISMRISFGFTQPFTYQYPSITNVYFIIVNSMLFMMGPLLYLYVLVITRPGFRLHPRHCLHLLPAVFCCIYFLHASVMMGIEQLGIYFDAYTFTIPSITLHIINIVYCIQPVVYILISIRFLAAHRRRIQGIFSSTEKLNLSWLTYILRFMLGAGILWIMVLLAYSGNQFLSFDHYDLLLNEVLDISINTTGGLMAIMFFAIGYRGLVQPEIFAGIPEDLVEEPDATEQKISIPPEKIREIMDKIITVMKEDRPYLDPCLTLPMLADMAGVSRNLLSQAINEHTKQNFYDFVNFYRVETVKEHLKDPAKRDMNVLHIAFDAGFNSKATFNGVFKKNTGVTPTAFRKSILDN